MKINTVRKSVIKVIFASLVIFASGTGCFLFPNEDYYISQLPSASEIGTPVLKDIPLDLADFAEIQPLGNVNPPGHTFPSDHHYFYLTNPDLQVPVYAPGDVWIIRISSSHHHIAGFTDYDMEMYPCQEIKVRFSHLSALSTEVQQAFDAADITSTETYSTGGETYTRVNKVMSFKVSSGTLIGYTGGNPGLAAFDLGIYDTRHENTFANPDRKQNDQFIHAIACHGYYDSDTEELLNSLTMVTGVPRTAEPVGGTIDVDIAGTAQGRWYIPGKSNEPEDPHIALVPYFGNPDVLAFSIGTSLDGLYSSYTYFDPVLTGNENRAFSSITADGQVYVYPDIGGGLKGNEVLILKLVNDQTMRVEVQTDTDGPPWNFTANSTTYIR